MNLAEENVRAACQKIIDLWQEDAGWALRFVGEKPKKTYLDESTAINSQIRELANILAHKKSESEKIKNKFIKFGLGKIRGEISKIENQIDALSSKLDDLDSKQKEARDNYNQLLIETGEALIGYEKILRSVGQDLKSIGNYSVEKKFPFTLGKFDNDGKEVFSIHPDKMFKFMGYDRQIE